MRLPKSTQALISHLKEFSVPFGELSWEYVKADPHARDPWKRKQGHLRLMLCGHGKSAEEIIMQSDITAQARSRHVSSNARYLFWQLVTALAVQLIKKGDAEAL